MRPIKNAHGADAFVLQVERPRASDGLISVVKTRRGGKSAAFDGEALMWPNPLADDEAGLCRRINRDREAALRDLVLRIHEVEIEEPRLVGVDGLGIDVRGRFDVLRVGFDPPVVDAAGAAETDAAAPPAGPEQV